MKMIISPYFFEKIHLTSMLYKNAYIFVFPFSHEIMDKTYCILFFSVPITWIFTNLNVFYLYLIRIFHENNTNIVSFPNKLTYEYFFHVNQLFSFISIMVVNHRTLHIPYTLFIPTMILYYHHVYCIYYYNKIKHSVIHNLLWLCVFGCLANVFLLE